MIEKRGKETMFLMTPAEHRQWVENARRVNRPDLAQQHEQLARAIEIRQQQRLSTQEVKKKPRVSGAEYFGGTSTRPHPRYDRQIGD